MAIGVTFPENEDVVTFWWKIERLVRVESKVDIYKKELGNYAGYRLRKVYWKDLHYWGMKISRDAVTHVNLYLTLFGYLQVWIVSLHCGVWKVILSAQWQTLRVLSTISAVQCILSLQGLDFLYLLQRNRYMLFSYCLKIRMYSLKRKILVCCTRRSCTWCPEGLFENWKCLWGSVCCGQLHSFESTLWRSNQQKQINASPSVSPRLLFLSKFSGTEVNTCTYSFHIWIVVTSYSYEWSH